MSHHDYAHKAWGEWVCHPPSRMVLICLEVLAQVMIDRMVYLFSEWIELKLTAANNAGKTVKSPAHSGQGQRPSLTACSSLPLSFLALFIFPHYLLSYVCFCSQQ